MPPTGPLRRWALWLGLVLFCQPLLAALHAGTLHPPACGGEPHLEAGLPHDSPSCPVCAVLHVPRAGDKAPQADLSPVAVRFARSPAPAPVPGIGLRLLPPSRAPPSA